MAKQHSLERFRLGFVRVRLRVCVRVHICVRLCVCVRVSTLVRLYVCEHARALFGDTFSGKWRNGQLVSVEGGAGQWHGPSELETMTIGCSWLLRCGEGPR